MSRHDRADRGDHRWSGRAGHDARRVDGRRRGLVRSCDHRPAKYATPARRHRRRRPRPLGARPRSRNIRGSRSRDVAPLPAPAASRTQPDRRDTASHAAERGCPAARHSGAAGRNSGHAGRCSNVTQDRRRSAARLRCRNRARGPSIRDDHPDGAAAPASGPGEPRSPGHAQHHGRSSGRRHRGLCDRRPLSATVPHGVVQRVLHVAHRRRRGESGQHHFGPAAGSADDRDVHRCRNDPGRLGGDRAGFGPGARTRSGRRPQPRRRGRPRKCRHARPAGVARARLSGRRGRPRRSRVRRAVRDGSSTSTSSSATRAARARCAEPTWRTPQRWS